MWLVVRIIVRVYFNDTGIASFFAINGKFALIQLFFYTLLMRPNKVETCPGLLKWYNRLLYGTVWCWWSFLSKYFYFILIWCWRQIAVNRWPENCNLATSNLCISSQKINYYSRGIILEIINLVPVAWYVVLTHSWYFVRITHLIVITHRKLWK